VRLLKITEVFDCDNIKKYNFIPCSGEMRNFVFLEFPRPLLVSSVS